MTWQRLPFGSIASGSESGTRFTEHSWSRNDFPDSTTILEAALDSGVRDSGAHT